jgi:hypothetical protein
MNLIYAALSWILENPATIGLSRTSLSDEHGQRLLSFFTALPECSSNRNKPRVSIEMYEVEIKQFRTITPNYSRLNYCMVGSAGANFQDTATADL